MAEQGSLDPIWPPRKSYTINEDTYFCNDTADAATLAAGSAINLVDAVMEEDTPLHCGMAVVRPPGHHASADRSAGFCLFNNVAIAARHLQKVHGLRKVLIVDWDVHHGDGTSNIFADDPDVMFFSVHRHGKGFFPGTGILEDAGKNPAQGYTVNVPLLQGFTDVDVCHVIRHVLFPLVDRFQPEFILVSAGFDAVHDDPLGNCRMTPQGFGWVTRCLYSLAKHYCHGRLLLVLEGGYNNTNTSRCAVECVAAMVLEIAGLAPLSNSLPPIPELQCLSSASPRPKGAAKAEKSDKAEKIAVSQTEPPANVTENAKKWAPALYTANTVRKLTELHNILQLQLPLAPKRAEGVGKSTATGNKGKHQRQICPKPEAKQQTPPPEVHVKQESESEAEVEPEPIVTIHREAPKRPPPGFLDWRMWAVVCLLIAIVIRIQPDMGSFKSRVAVKKLSSVKQPSKTLKADSKGQPQAKKRKEVQAVSGEGRKDAAPQSKHQKTQKKQPAPKQPSLANSQKSVSGKDSKETKPSVKGTKPANTIEQFGQKAKPRADNIKGVPSAGGAKHKETKKEVASSTTSKTTQKKDARDDTAQNKKATREASSPSSKDTKGKKSSVVGDHTKANVVEGRATNKEVKKVAATPKGTESKKPHPKVAAVHAAAMQAMAKSALGHGKSCGAPGAASGIMRYKKVVAAETTKETTKKKLSAQKDEGSGAASRSKQNQANVEKRTEIDSVLDDDEQDAAGIDDEHKQENSVKLNDKDAAAKQKADSKKREPTREKAKVDAKSPRERSKNLEETAFYTLRRSTDISEVHLFIPIPKSVRPKDLQIKITGHSFLFQIAGKKPLIDGIFWRQVNPEDSFWEIGSDGGKRCVRVTLRKQRKMEPFERLLLPLSPAPKGRVPF